VNNAVEIEVSHLNNRHTPNMVHRSYSSTIRNPDTSYNLLPHLTPRGESTSGYVILGVLLGNNLFKISDLILHGTLFRGTKLCYSRKSMMF